MWEADPAFPAFPRSSHVLQLSLARALGSHARRSHSELEVTKYSMSLRGFFLHKLTRNESPRAVCSHPRARARISQT